MNNENKIKELNKKYVKKITIGLIPSVILTFLVYKVFCNISESGSNTVTFNHDHLIAIFGIFVGLYGTFFIVTSVHYLIKRLIYCAKDKTQP